MGIISLKDITKMKDVEATAKKDPFIAA